MRTWKRSCLFMAICCVFPLYAGPKPADICQHQYCEIVVDAGSTGTRFYLYTLDLKNFVSSYDMVLLDKHTIDKALNDYNDEQMFTILDELFGEYKTYPIQVYMYATEGLRSLSLDERKKRFSLAKQWFNTKSKLILKELRTLGGEEEGILLWLANAIDLVKNTSMQSVDDIAVFEIGGGSAQIALPIKQNNVQSNHHVYPIHFLGQTMKIWSMSFPELGINKIKDAYENNQSCYAKHYPMMNHQLGNGDIAACILGMKQYKQSHGLSSLDSVVKTRNLLQQEIKRYQWYGFGVPNYIGQSSILGFPRNEYNLSELKSRADDKACKSDWSIQEKNFSMVQHKEKLCYSSAYITWFASDLLNLPLSTSIHYRELDSGLGWSKGSVIKRHTVV